MRLEECSCGLDSLSEKTDGWLVEIIQSREQLVLLQHPSIPPHWRQRAPANRRPQRGNASATRMIRFFITADISGCERAGSLWPVGGAYFQKQVFTPKKKNMFLITFKARKRPSGNRLSIHLSFMVWYFRPSFRDLMSWVVLLQMYIFLVLLDVSRFIPSVNIVKISSWS